MGIRKDYIKAATKTILTINPTLDKDRIEKIVTQIMKERMKNPTIVMDNNVTGDNATITLTELCGWIEKRNPVISGNGTFYVQPTELLSPTSNMLRSLKKGRKEVKGKMFSLDPSSDEYQMLDLMQQNLKVIMNAEYGGSGTPTAAFYTKYSPAATTLMAQSIITTMAAFFEGFVGDNQKLFSVNECYDWMNNILSRKKGDIPDWITVPTVSETTDRIFKHFMTPDIRDYELLRQYIEHCSDQQRVYLFYANNMMAFIKMHPEVSDLLYKILNSLPLLEASEKEIPNAYKDQFDELIKYNKWVSKEMFLDPYHPPVAIKEYLEKLKKYVGQFVFVEYITPDSIVKLNNHYRNTVLLVDTDSNIIHADLFVDFIKKEIFHGEMFNRKGLYHDMILTNILASLLDGCVASILDLWARLHHMDEASRKELTMKNEFFFRTLFLMKKKKRYAASIANREGNIMIPFKIEIKGLDFIKAGVTEEVMDRFQSILKKYILCAEEPQLHDMMKDIKSFEREIKKDLKSGGTKYLKPQAYKAEEAYAKIKDANGKVIGSKAWSLPVFRGSAVWNELYPTERIYSLDRVKIVKLIVDDIHDLDPIKEKYPEDYQNIITRIYQSESPDIRKAGLRVISVPGTLKQLPGWITELIDYDIIVSDVMSSFRSVLDALSMEDTCFKTPNGTANPISCLISL